MIQKTSLLVVFLSLFSFSAFAQNDQADVKEALRLTQEMLKDPEQRNQEIGKGADKKAADQKVKDVAGSEKNEQAIYELAASVFGTLVSETGGDMDKVQELLDEGMKNPEAFAKKWSPEELTKLHQISQAVPPKSSPSSTSPGDTKVPQKSTTYRPPVVK